LGFGAVWEPINQPTGLHLLPVALPRRGRGLKTGRVVPRMLVEVRAHITGTVWKIEVSVGDSVEEGDSVAILESMKMEMPVEAPGAGTVTSIAVAEGQAVDEGDLLATLESA
jgi:acetyl-CoA carboxylase biotin carboxyl carrier protein